MKKTRSLIVASVLLSIAAVAIFATYRFARTNDLSKLPPPSVALYSRPPGTTFPTTSTTFPLAGKPMTPGEVNRRASRRIAMPTHDFDYLLPTIKSRFSTMFMGSLDEVNAIRQKYGRRIIPDNPDFHRIIGDRQNRLSKVKLNWSKAEIYVESSGGETSYVETPAIWMNRMDSWSSETAAEGRPTLPKNATVIKVVLPVELPEDIANRVPDRMVVLSLSPDLFGAGGDWQIFRYGIGTIQGDPKEVRMIFLNYE